MLYCSLVLGFLQFHCVQQSSCWQIWENKRRRYKTRVLGYVSSTRRRREETQLHVIEIVWFYCALNRLWKLNYYYYIYLCYTYIDSPILRIQNKIVPEDGDNHNNTQHQRPPNEWEAQGTAEEKTKALLLPHGARESFELLPD